MSNRLVLQSELFQRNQHQIINLQIKISMIISFLKTFHTDKNLTKLRSNLIEVIVAVWLMIWHLLLKVSFY